MEFPIGDARQFLGALQLGASGAGGLGGAVQPFTHTGQYVAQSWRDYLGQAPDELPIARPTLALAAQAFRDEVVLLGLKARRPVTRPDIFEHITREVVAGLEFYGDRGWLDNPKIAVGTALTSGPPHRSQRAGLPHWAPASDPGVESHRGERMPYAGGWQPPFGKASHPVPVQPTPLASAA